MKGGIYQRRGSALLTQVFEELKRDFILKFDERACLGVRSIFGGESTVLNFWVSILSRPP